MVIEAAGSGAVLIIAIMALVTLATRWGGVWVMGHVPLKPVVKRFISAMSSSVLIAVLAPLAMDGDAGARVALAVTALFMWLLRKPLPSVIAGMLSAALVRLTLA